MSHIWMPGLGAEPALPDLTSVSEFLPTRDAVREIYAPYQETIDQVPIPRGFDPVKFVTSGESLTTEGVLLWSFDMVKALQKHLNLSPPDLSMLKEIANGKLKWLNEYGIPLTTIPRSVRDAAIALATCAAFNACKQLGIPPEIGTLTVESLADGELTSSDVQAMGGLAGGLAGSYIGGIIGIPPQLGGFVGGYLGKMLGGGLSDVLGIGGGSAAREERMRADRARRAAVRGMLEQVRGQYQNLIVPQVRQMFWLVFDNALTQIEDEWEKAECQAGARFPLLWGASSGAMRWLPTRADPFLRYTFDGSRCPSPDFRLSRDPNLCLDFGRPLSPGTPTGCPSLFGCPYPDFPNLGAGDVERVARAFAAYNVWWLQPPSRTSNTVAWQERVPRASSATVYKIADLLKRKEDCASSKCRSDFDSYVNMEVGKYKSNTLDAYVNQSGPNRVVEAAMRIQADVAASAGIYAAIYALRGNTEMFRTNIQSAITSAVSDSRERATIQMREQGRLLRAQKLGGMLDMALNYGVPLAGAALLGAALFRGRR